MMPDESYFEELERIEGNLDAILANSAKILVKMRQTRPLSILLNAKPSVTGEITDEGYLVKWWVGLAVPIDVFLSLEDRRAIENAIDDALSVIGEAISDTTPMLCRIKGEFEDDPEWRRKMRQFIAGEGVTNQGRVRSNNIAALQHDGLLFRSKPETYFYDALKSAGVPFAPLPVCLKGGHEYRRTEPDFLIFKDGIIMIVEIDGDLFYSETPAHAHARLKFLLDEGTKIERVTASACDTPEKAREAVARVIRTIDKLRKAH